MLLLCAKNKLFVRWSNIFRSYSLVSRYTDIIVKNNVSICVKRRTICRSSASGVHIFKHCFASRYTDIIVKNIVSIAWKEQIICHPQILKSFVSHKQTKTKTHRNSKIKNIVLL